MDEFQQKQQQLIKEEEKKKSGIRHCKKCGATIDADTKFCPECGEKVGGEEKTCRWCGFATTKDICPECGKRVVPRICPQCGKDSYFDICEQCGNILSSEMQAQVQQEVKPVKEMSQADAESIIKEFEESETDELKYFERKIKEHEILLAEKKFFDEREKRIDAAFGHNSSSLNYPDPEETQFLQKAAEGIKKDVERRIEETLQEKLELIIPGAKSEEEEHEELLRLIKQREELLNQEFSENMNKVEAEITLAAERRRKEAEELARKIEEQRKREEEIARERRRLEIEAFNNRICGTYISCRNGEKISLSISLGEDGILYGKDLTEYDNNHYAYSGSLFVAKFVIENWDGNTFSFEETERRFIKNPHNLSVDCFLHKFYGTLNSQGTVINGHWINIDNSKPFGEYRKY